MFSPAGGSYIKPILNKMQQCVNCVGSDRQFDTASTATKCRILNENKINQNNVQVATSIK